MTPAPLTAALLALAAWRTYRLLALDDFPPLVAARNRLVGAHFPHKRPVFFDRPLLADWLACPYCSGLWWSAAWYAAWLEWPHATVYAAVPLALNMAWAALQERLPR